MRTNDTGITPAHDNYEDSEVNQENSTSRLSECVEPNSDQNVTTYSNESGSHSDSRSVISGNRNGNIQGSEGGEPVKHGTANTVRLSRCSSIDNATIFSWYTYRYTPGGMSIN